MKKPQIYLDEALKELEIGVMEILNNPKLPLAEKDALVFPYIQRKRVIKQAIEDLDYLDERGDVMRDGATCKMSLYR